MIRHPYRHHALIAGTLALFCLAGSPNASAQTIPAGAPTVPPLLDNNGTPLAPVPWAMPAHPAHRTRSGLYATEAQALAHENGLPGKVIRVHVGCCGAQGMQDAMLATWYQYVAYDAPSDMPVLVRGDDLQRAARLADRLSDAGFAPVFLVSVP